MRMRDTGQVAIKFMNFVSLMKLIPLANLGKCDLSLDLIVDSYFKAPQWKKITTFET